MSARMYEALPPYLGGKRRLVGAVFRHLPPARVAPVLADAFLGGGSVSLCAKARGYRVLCNDVAERSVTVGKALIENGRVRLADEDVLRLFVPTENDGFCRARLAPDVVTPVHAAFLDNAMAVARATPGTKGWLLRLLCVKYLLGQRPMGNFGAKSIVHQLAEGDWDAVNPAYLRDAVSRMVLAHPLEAARAIAARIDGGIFATPPAHEAHQGDAVDFLRRVRADVAYLDSPYAGTSAYETALRPLDEMLAGRPLDPVPSRFSTGDALETLTELFDAARHVPVWALSYGGPRVDLQALADRMARYRRRVVAHAVRYAHLAALASVDARARNEELILVGWA